MSKKSYYDLLKHPKWQERRLDVLNRAGFACEECGDKETTLHVHHLQYRKGAKPWEYADQELRCLCENCHARSHDIKAEIDARLAEIAGSDGLHGLKRVLGYVRAATADLLERDIPGIATVQGMNLDDMQGVADFIGPTMLSVDGMCEVARENGSLLEYGKLKEIAELLDSAVRHHYGEAIHEGNEHPSMGGTDEGR